MIINFIHSTISTNLSDGKGGGFSLSNRERVSSFPEDKLLNIDAYESNSFGKTTHTAGNVKENLRVAEKKTMSREMKVDVRRSQRISPNR